MNHHRLLSAAALLCLAAAGAARSQGMAPFPGGNQGVPPANRAPFGGPLPGGNPVGPTPMQGPTGPAPGFGGQPGFGNQPPAGPNQQPARQNYAEELTDFNVPPQSQMQPNVGSPTPTSIPGGHVITTNEMRQAGQVGIIVVDVLEGPPHPQIPGSLWMPGAGAAGTFEDQVQQQLWTALSQATQMQPDRPIAFLCAGSKCWESYNAALRAQNMGFKMVLWYRGGLAAWQAAGLPLTNPGQGQQPPPQRNGSGFNR